MEIKIVSDGTLLGTRIYDAVTGAELKNVIALEWVLSTENGWSETDAIVKMTLINVPVELKGKATVTIEELTPS